MTVNRQRGGERPDLCRRNSDRGAVSGREWHNVATCNVAEKRHDSPSFGGTAIALCRHNVMQTLQALRASLLPFVALAFVYGCGSSDAEDAAGSTGAATSTGAAGTGGSSGTGGAAGTGNGGYVGWGGKCTTAFQCPVPAVACASGIGSPYKATCIDGVCGLENVSCPSGGPSVGGMGGGGGAGGYAGGGTAGGAGAAGQPGGCGLWGCCEQASDCKSAPAVGPGPCWTTPDGGTMACQQKLCTWVPYSCPPPPSGTAIDQLDAACGECAKTMTGAPASLPTVDCAAVNAGCGGGGGDCYKSLHCVQQKASSGDAASNDCAVNACSAVFDQQKPAKNLYACLADKCGAACKLTPGFTTTVCN